MASEIYGLRSFQKVTLVLICALSLIGTGTALSNTLTRQSQERRMLPDAKICSFTPIVPG